MNIKAISTIAKLVPGIAGKMKGWIFADGKFQLNRAAMLLAFFGAILVAGHFVGYDNVAIAIGLLDEVSDAVGYAE